MSARQHQASLACALGKLLAGVSSAARNPALPLTPAPLLAQALLLTAYEKMLVAEPNNAALREAVEAVLTRYSGTMDAELAQRAIEYRQLAARLDVARAAVQPLPKWEKRASLLLRRLAEKEVGGGGLSGAAEWGPPGWAGGQVETSARAACNCGRVRKAKRTIWCGCLAWPRGHALAASCSPTAFLAVASSCCVLAFLSGPLAGRRCRRGQGAPGLDEPEH